MLSKRQQVNVHCHAQSMENVLFVHKDTWSVAFLALYWGQHASLIYLENASIVLSTGANVDSKYY